jgi:FkbM family methyltransferase
MKTSTINTVCHWSSAHVLNVAWTMCLYNPVVDVYVSGSIARTGNWEGHFVSQMVEVMRKHNESMLVDVGGNIGFYSLAAARAGFDVHVFEPVPRNAEMIRASVRRNALQDKVQLHTCALSDAPGELLMGEHESNQGGVAHHKISGKTPAPTRIPAFRLDDILPPTARPVYVKIDIEGGECAAFKGMMAFLRDTHIVGLNMEFVGQRPVTRQCCPQWVAQGGVFDVLYTRHSLCPQGVSYAAVCASVAWDLVWAAC